ncbi:MAG TPA: GDP-L-fucose synthase [Rhizomicrobium sp.]
MFEPNLFPLKGKRIWVAGHRGMAGSAIARRLSLSGSEVLTIPRSELDLTDARATRAHVHSTRPDAIVIAAAKVGGILANDTYPVDFLRDNLAIELSIIGAAHEEDVGRLLFLGSTCIYPRDAKQPLTEDSLLTGPLETTNEWYAVAKIAGIKLGQAYRRQYGRDYISAMPTNLFGPGDNYHPDHSHMVAGLIRRIHGAKVTGKREVVMWGTGEPRREIMHVDDLADACAFLLEQYSDGQIINVGQGEDHSINDIAKAIAKAVEWEGEFKQDLTKPDGTPRKQVNGDRLFAAGWRPKYDMHTGLANAYEWFAKHTAANIGA